MKQTTLFFLDCVYRTILVFKFCAYICSKGCFAGLIFGGAYFRRGLQCIIGRNFAFQDGIAQNVIVVLTCTYSYGLGLTIKAT